MSPVNDILQNKTEVYRGEAKLPGRPAAAFFCILALAAVCVAAFNLSSMLPYGVFLKLAVLALAALGVNYILKKGTFSVTYVLTDDDMLIYVTKYGLLSWESAWIKLREAKIEKNRIIFENRRYDFYPDEDLKKILATKEKPI